MGAGRHSIAVLENGPEFPLGWLLPQERSRWWVTGFEGKSLTASEGLKNLAVSLHSKAVQAAIGTGIGSYKLLALL
jgi:hypothetical protein